MIQQPVAKVLFHRRTEFHHGLLANQDDVLFDGAGEGLRAEQIE